MVLAELFLSAFLEVLFERLASRELLQFASQEGVRSKLKKWEKTLKMIEAVLIDAEEKQLTDRAVKMWLDDLRDLAYDVEDILDEFATEALGRKLMAGSDQTGSSKVWRLIPACFSWLSPSAVKFDISMGSKMKDISSRLEEIYKRRTELGLEKIAGGAPAAVRLRTPTTCLPSEPVIYGRDEDKKNILEMVLRVEPSDANFQVISIVGMAGVGKTTLAQEVYNDEAVNDFNPKAWVCVSDDFDVLRISKAILESITLSPCDLKDLNQVQVQLNNVIAGRKFLLVLDDVWSKSYDLWQALKSPFMAGGPGSKIIVTTRNVEVALTMGPIEYYNLKLLSDDDCWSLFGKHAFESRAIEKYGDLALIRKKVVEKCKGLPLAARALGGLFRSKQRIDEWKDILNNKIWDLSDENEIPAVLKISYHHLPSHLKRCFAYCAIFPKDYEFEEKELVLLWMAEGLIQQSYNNKQPEELGGEYFREFLSRSIFQQLSSNRSKFIIHDLVNDLAQWASGESSFRLEDEIRANIQSQRLEKARHSSYTSGYLGDNKNRFESFHEVRNLRTFLPISIHSRPHFITNTILFDLLPKFKKLRVLSLMHYYLPELPNSIGNLIHLRYLNLCNTQVRCLPESISSLFNLQILILRDCFHLKKLPSNMRSLINLRHLDIRGASLLREMPVGIRNLKHLQTLSNFIVGNDTGCSLKDLKSLKFLRGELCISGLENATDLQNLNEVLLIDKEDLEVLIVEWGPQFNGLQNEVMAESLLNSLQPHRNLKQLTIKRYCGIRFPSWIGNPSFSNMVVLRLENCETCTSLPSIGLLSSLKDLTVQGMTGLKSISFEIYGDGCLKPFESLESLRFENLQEWESWNAIEEDEHGGRFPRLRELSILNCPKLSGKLPEHLPSLRKLLIRECDQLMVSFSSFPVLSDLEINGCQGMVWGSLADSKSLKSMTFSNISQIGNWLTRRFQKVEHLKIYSEELVHFWMNQICLEKSQAGLHSFTSLRMLCIRNCSNLVSFQEACFLPVLRKLEIIACNGLTSIVKDQLPSSLKELRIGSSEKLECLLDDREDISSPSSSSSAAVFKENMKNSIIPLLENLSIGNCPSLTCLSSRGWLPEVKVLKIKNCPRLISLSSNGRLPKALEVLHIRDFSRLESIAERFNNNTSLRDISIRNCDIKSIPEGLHHLARLQRIFIGYCPNFFSFPEGGFPNTSLTVSIRKCEKLEALPNHLHKLNSLTIYKCPGIIFSSERGFPTNLTSLTIEGDNIYEQLIRWELHKLTSLRELRIMKCPDAVSFPEEEKGMMLPSSLTTLKIESFSELRYLSSEGFGNLTSLEILWLKKCPKLLSFPEMGLPSSLLQLHIGGCYLLKKRCKRDKGQEWSKIVDIPEVKLDNKYINNPE